MLFHDRYGILLVALTTTTALSMQESLLFAQLGSQVALVFNRDGVLSLRKVYALTKEDA